MTRASSQLTTRPPTCLRFGSPWDTSRFPAPNDSSLSPPAINYTTYPDGYQLGQELGSDAGNVTRHRAFYIYDRSIPVGFNPGKDLNYDKGILVKRFIE